MLIAYCDHCGVLIKKVTDEDEYHTFRDKVFHLCLSCSVELDAILDQFYKEPKKPEGSDK